VPFFYGLNFHTLLYPLLFNYIGSDVTRLVNFFKHNTSLCYCADYEPDWFTPDDLPDDMPPGWPGV